MELEHFHCKTSLRVRSYEVDWQGIVHNTVYLLYCEIGRVEYLKTIGADLDLNKINSSHRVVLSRNEIDYLSPAHFDMEIDVYTRIPEIGNSSFIFEGLLINASTNAFIAKNRAVHVWLQKKTGLPIRVPDSFRLLVRNYEGERLKQR